MNIEEELVNILKDKCTVHFYYTNISGFIVEIYKYNTMFGTSCNEELKYAIQDAITMAKKGK